MLKGVPSPICWIPEWRGRPGRRRQPGPKREPVLAAAICDNARLVYIHIRLLKSCQPQLKPVALEYAIGPQSRSRRCVGTWMSVSDGDFHCATYCSVSSSSLTYLRRRGGGGIPAQPERRCSPCRPAAGGVEVF